MDFTFKVFTATLSDYVNARDLAFIDPDFTVGDQLDAVIRSTDATLSVGDTFFGGQALGNPISDIEYRTITTDGTDVDVAVLFVSSTSFVHIVPIDTATNSLTGGAIATGDYQVGASLDATGLSLEPPVVSLEPVGVEDSYSTVFQTPLEVPALLGVLSNDTDADGDTPTAAIDTPPANGMVTLDPDGSFTYTPDPGFSGADTFTYIATDDDGNSAPTMVTIDVGAPTPPATVLVEGYPVSDEALNAALSAFGSDVLPIGGTRTARIESADGILSVGDLVNTFEFGGTLSGTPIDEIEFRTLTLDGVAYQVAILRFGLETENVLLPLDPAAGEIVARDLAEGVYEFGPPLDQNVFALVDTANAAPVAEDDAYTTTVGAVLEIDVEDGVLDNDTDVDNDPLTATLMTGPSDGTLALDQDGSFTYTPNPGFSGTDSFTYLAGDGTDASAPATVEIDIQLPSTPPATVLVEGYPVSDEALNAALSAFGSDVLPIGGTRTARIESADGILSVGDLVNTFEFGGTLSGTPIDEIEFRTLTLDGVAYQVAILRFGLETENVLLPLDPAAGEIVARDLAEGVYEFGPPLDQNVFALVDTANAAPTVTPIVKSASEDDALLTFSLLEDADDPDGDTLSVQNVDAIAADGRSLEGILSLAGADVSFDPDGFNDLGTGDSETVTISYEVFDGTVATENTAVITVSGVNDVASLTGAFEGAVTEDADPSTASGKIDVTDDDAGQAFVAVQTDAPGTYGTFSILADGTWTYTLDNALAATDALTEGETVTAAFTVTSQDGSASEVVEITVTGANDGAMIGGDLDGAVTEDAGVPATGTASVSDPDAGEATFVAASGMATYGTFAVGPDGTWSYTLDDTDPAVDALNTGDPLTDSFTLTTADGTTETVTIDITGANDAPVVIGDLAAPVVEGETVTLKLADLDATDVDDEDDDLVFAVSEATNGVVALSGAPGTAVTSFTRAQLAAEQVVFVHDGSETGTAAFTAVASDGVASSAPVIVALTVTGQNDVASLTGAFEGAVTEDADPSTASGKIDVTDDDAGQAFVAVQTDAPGTYGTFSILADGTWTYTLDNALAATDALTEGETVTAAFTVTSQDGSASEVVEITVTGANDGAMIGGDLDGAVTEDAGVPATGTASVSDPDTGEATFVAASGMATYGTFAVGPDGTWSYTLDDTDPAVDALNTGDPLTDSFTLTTADGTTETVTIDITGANDAPVVIGDLAAPVVEGETVTLKLADLDATDVDDEDDDLVFAVSEATNGVVALSGAPGTAVTSFTRAQLAAEQVVFVHDGSETGTAAFTAVASDGVASSAPVIVALTVTGQNDVASLTGAFEGAVTEDADPSTASGKIDVTDDDAGQAFVAVQTDAPGTYGTFSILADGTWTYTLDNALAATDALTEGETVTAAFTVTSQDGSASEVVEITVTGANDGAMIGGDLDGAVTEDAGVPATGTASVSDPDAGEATFVAASGMATYGTFAVGPDGTWSYTLDDTDPAVDALNTGDPLTDSFTLTTADGTTETVTIDITGANDAPLAVDDTFTAYAGTTLLILAEAGVLANDSDVDGGALMATAVGDPANGTLALSGDGALTYTPDDGFFGADNFDYIVMDGRGGTSTASVTIEVIPDSDGDGVFDDTDNATFVFNPDQRDSNGDGIGNVVDPDLNQDNVVNGLDLDLLAVSFGQNAPVDPNDPRSGLDADFNGDGTVNGLDLDILATFFGNPPGPSASDFPFT